MSRHAAIALVLPFVVVMVSACGSDSSASPDASTAIADASATLADASAALADASAALADASAALADASPALADASTSACASGFTSATQSAIEDPSSLFFTAESSETDPFDRLAIEFYYELGASDQPHIFNAWENYETCHTCVLLFAECEAGSSCGKIFLANAGELEVTVNANGNQPGALAATLTNVTLSEVEIDPDTFASIPVPGGACIEIPTFSVDVVSTPP